MPRWHRRSISGTLAVETDPRGIMAYEKSIVDVNAKQRH